MKTNLMVNQTCKISTAPLFLILLNGTQLNEETSNETVRTGKKRDFFFLQLSVVHVIGCGEQEDREANFMP